MNITKLVYKLYFAKRIGKIRQYDRKAEKIQMAVLKRLLRLSRDTEWGRMHGHRVIKTYADFTTRVPINTYEELKGYIQRMREGEADVLWKGQVKWFAKSSGTTNDKSKFIPVSKEGLKDTHYMGGTDCVASYLYANPESRLFSGKSLILGGSHTPNLNTPHTLVGDLSAIMIENVPALVNYIRIPSKKTALLSDFEQKRDKIAKKARKKNVTNISGVPSWMLSVLTRMMEIEGTDRIDNIWPNLEVFFHGGVAFTPYREQYRKIIQKAGMHYMETYNASEGFFGVQTDMGDQAMKLMIDYGVFYEFIPMSEFGTENPTVLPLWKVEPGVNYAMVISTSSGLWRYVIGDTVRFTQKNPYKFVITGRTKHFINAFGEELIIDNAEKGLKEACEKTGAQVREYTAAPIFMDGNAQCRHQWLIEFAQAPESVEEFASILDKSLQAINSDYEAKRYKDITLQPLEIVVARQGLFEDWLKSKGKLGGQHKVPRLSNSREYIDELLSM